MLLPNKHMQIEELKKKNITISEINMKHRIDQFRGDKTTAFAHCILADISCHRNMSAGVAVTFQNCFGRPSASNFEESHLTYQKEQNTATVYGLVTKAQYYQKQTLEDDDIAFRQMTENFVKQKMMKRTCSPMGCVRDKIPLKHFAAQIVKFQRSTGASIDIFSQQTYRDLFCGLTRSDFVNQQYASFQLSKT